MSSSGGEVHTGPPLDIPALLGPWVIGAIFGSYMYGILIVQIILYYLWHPDDHRFHKIIVGLLGLASTATWAIVIYIIYYLTIIARSDDWKIVKPGTIVYVPFLIGGISAVFHQWFFALRSYELYNRNKWIGGLFLLLMILCLAVAAGAGNVDHLAPEIVISPTVIPWVADVKGETHSYFLGLALHETYLFICAITNIVITAALVWKVSRQQRGFRRVTDKLITRIVGLSISTSLLSTTFELVSAILLITTVSENETAFAFLMQLPNVYALAVVGSLNLRTVIDPRIERSAQQRARDQAARAGWPGSASSPRTGPSSGENPYPPDHHRQSSPFASGIGRSPSTSGTAGSGGVTFGGKRIGKFGLKNSSSTGEGLGNTKRARSSKKSSGHSHGEAELDSDAITTTSIMIGSGGEHIRAFSQRYGGDGRPPAGFSFDEADEDVLNVPLPALSRPDLERGAPRERFDSYPPSTPGSTFTPISPSKKEYSHSLSTQPSFESRITHKEPESYADYPPPLPPIPPTSDQVPWEKEPIEETSTPSWEPPERSRTRSFD